MLEMIGITYIPTKRFDQNLADSVALDHYVISSCQFILFSPLMVFIYFIGYICVRLYIY